MTATILLVDPDPAARRRTADGLEAAGFRVRAHGVAAEALDDAAAVEPDALVWATRTAEDRGLWLLRAWRRRFPGRWTPAVVLAPTGEPAEVARVLEAGADDCLVDPGSQALLVATLRARIRNRAATRLRGDLEALPFARLMQFCERTGLTGALEVGDERVEFVAGALAPGARAAAARLLGARAGPFVLRARAVDLAELSAAGAPAPSPPSPAAAPLAPLAPLAPAATAAASEATLHPAGRLSGIRLGDRVLQIQTEYTTLPEPRIVTVVMLGGRTVHQRVAVAPRGAAREELERQITTQHVDVERSVEARAEARGARPGADAPEVRFERLHDDGLERFLVGDFAAAVEAWEAALRIAPGNQALSINLAVARRKRDAPAPASGA